MSRSFNFNTSNYLSVATPVTTATNNISFGSWVYLNNNTNGNSMTSVSVGGTNGINILFNGFGTGSISIDAFGVGDATVSGITIPAQTWWYVMFARGTGGATAPWNLYSTGGNQISFSTLDFNTPTTRTTIGIRGDINNPANGYIADAAWWSVQLTATEGTSLTKGERPNRIRPKSLLAWWPLDGLQSPEPDLSGTANNMSITGSVPAGFGPPFMMFTPLRQQFIPAIPSIVLAPAQIAAHFQRRVSVVGY
jgi:hypothetical protein